MSARNPPQGQAAVAETATEGPLCGRAGRDGLALPLCEELPSLRAGEDVQEAAGWSGGGGGRCGRELPLTNTGEGQVLSWSGSERCGGSAQAVPAGRCGDKLDMTITGRRR